MSKQPLKNTVSMLIKTRTSHHTIIVVIVVCFFFTLRKKWGSWVMMETEHFIGMALLKKRNKLRGDIELGIILIAFLA